MGSKVSMDAVAKGEHEISKLQLRVAFFSITMFATQNAFDSFLKLHDWGIDDTYTVINSGKRNE